MDSPGQHAAVRARLLTVVPLQRDLPAVPTVLVLLPHRHDAESVQSNSSVVASPMLAAPRQADSTPTTLRSLEPYALTTRRSLEREEPAKMGPRQYMTASSGSDLLRRLGIRAWVLLRGERVVQGGGATGAAGGGSCCGGATLLAVEHSASD